MPLQEGPLRLLALQQVCAHGHLSTGNVCSKVLAHTTEGQVSTLCKDMGLFCEVKPTFFYNNKNYEIF